MDAVAIDEAIEALENESTTFDNVNELACLYIVREHLGNSRTELVDLFPYYKKYTEVKRRYQLDQTTEGEVIQNMKNVCKELQEFIEELHSHTDMARERKCLTDMLGCLYRKYQN